MRKMIRITMKDASIWEVPATVVAGHRAKYYFEEHGEEENMTYEDYLKESLDDDDGLLDWARNNMDWSDVKDVAKEFSPSPKLTDDDFQDAWLGNIEFDDGESNMEVVKVKD